MIKARSDAPDRTALERTAFCILGATTRDNRRRISELAEEKSLEIDAEICSRARADLMIPRVRLAAEIAWLPGLSPSRARGYCDVLNRDLDAFLVSATKEDSLVKANMIAAALERFDPATEVTEWVTWIMHLAEAAGHVDAEAVLRLLNEDRAVAGVPEIQTVAFLHSEFAERRRAYRDTIKEALDRMPTLAMLEVITRVVNIVTGDGARQGPILIDEVVDAFDVEARQFLDREAENVRRLIKAVNDSGVNNEGVVGRLLDGLERVVRNWNRVAQPINVSMRARGREHKPSRDLAYEIRLLSVELYNKEGLLGPVQRITNLLQEVFGELVGVADRLQEDASFLDDLSEQQRKAQEQSEQWASEIVYAAEIGVVFKDTLRLSTAGVEWKKVRYPLEAITRIGWGATRHSVNGIPTGTKYKILFGDRQGLSEVNLGHEPIFTGFVERLWRAVGLRLATELLQGLREGKRYRFGEAVLDDRGVKVPKRRLFRADERVYGTWDRIHVWDADGSFYIGVKGDKKAYAMLPYQEANNAHVLQTVIRAAFKKGSDQLSDLLKSD